ncbi:hypothetical protein Hdeb2414_s0026g00684111 [Helianthus debilis subsp. tardiflorus]
MALVGTWWRVSIAAVAAAVGTPIQFCRKTAGSHSFHNLVTSL